MALCAGMWSGLLKDLQLEHAGVSVEGTPRRLSVVVSQLATRQQQVRRSRVPGHHQSWSTAAVHGWP